jgi:polysulfide reductase chain C
MVYTGVLLSSMKAKPFWNTPALPVLFTTSALSTASAVMALAAGLWPATTFALPHQDQVQHFLVEQLHTIDSVLVIVEIVVLVVYVLMMYGAGNVTARTVAIKWLRGRFAVPFWGGIIFVGLLVPFVSYLTGGVMATAVAPVLVLASGLLLRFLIVYSDARRSIPGEERYWSRIPKGDEEFLTAWK